MRRVDRRRFLEQSMLAAVAAMTAGPARPLGAQEKQSTSPNEKLRVAVVGVRDRGWGHAQAFIDRDEVKARKIGKRDDEIDALYRAIFDELVEIMVDKPDAVERATYLLWCAHNLERIGDRVTNLAERVIFMSTGDMMELNI